MEYKRKGLKGYIDVRPTDGIDILSNEEIPVIEEEESGKIFLSKYVRPIPH